MSSALLMTTAFNHETIARREDLPRVAGLVAFALRAGDLVVLEGEIGAGKTAFAEAIIRAATGNVSARLVGPEEAVVRTCATPRFLVMHVDVRHSGQAALPQLDELLANGVVLFERTERARGGEAMDRLEIGLETINAACGRKIHLTGHGSWIGRLQRLSVLDGLMTGAGWSRANVEFLQGDASPRRYARVRDSERTALLMDAPRQPDGPPIRDGLPYSRIAHLAEDMRAFVGVQMLLKERGLAAPEIYLADVVGGALLIEDLGDRVYGREIAGGADMETLWRPAVEVLLRLRGVRPEAPVALRRDADFPDESLVHTIPLYDKRALGIETELLLDWYWLLAKGEPAPQAARDEFLALWSPILNRVIVAPQCLTLRDYHSPNLIALSGRGEDAAAKVGIIDFQDAVIGHPAYDVVSLLQDARLDVPQAIETSLLAHYCALAEKADPAFDENEFKFAYAALGAQRNTKILGIFARLFKRDGKPQYLPHIPRIWGYLARDLEHPALAPLKGWYDRHLPVGVRARRLGT